MRNNRLVGLIMALACAAMACNVPGFVPSNPTVAIQAPADGDAVPINEPVVISAMGVDSDGPGIKSIELFVNGDSIRVIESPTDPQDVFEVAYTWTPTEEGPTTVTAIAYREDESPSPPAQITLKVVGVTVEITEALPSETNTASGPIENSTPEPTLEQIFIPGRVVVSATFRVGPGPACPIVSGVRIGEQINLFAYSADRRWIQTFYSGQLGWISTAAVAPESDTSLLPITSETGCAGCGDHVCSASETCSVCSRDCGTCVPPTATPIPTKTATATVTRTPTKTLTPSITPSQGPTAAPTTAVPTTAVPTTVVPTTAVPTTPPTTAPTVEPTTQP